MKFHNDMAGLAAGGLAATHFTRKFCGFWAIHPSRFRSGLFLSMAQTVESCVPGRSLSLNLA